MKILFMDDDQTRHDHYERWLSEHREKVTQSVQVYNGEQAMEAMRSTRFDLAHLDHDMGSNAYARYHDPSIPKDPNEIDGTDVANFIVSLLPEQRPLEVNCHSFVRENRVKMARILKGVGIRTSIYMFPKAF